MPARSAKGSNARLRPEPRAKENPTVSTATGSMNTHADSGIHHHAAACMADANSSAAMPTRTMVCRPNRAMKAGARKKAAMLIAALPPNQAEKPSSE
ncbi:hypothetical protein D3C86_1929040 [compost metagenome]